MNTETSTSSTTGHPLPPWRCMTSQALRRGTGASTAKMAFVTILAVVGGVVSGLAHGAAPAGGQQLSLSAPQRFRDVSSPGRPSLDSPENFARSRWFIKRSDNEVQSIATFDASAPPSAFGDAFIELTSGLRNELGPAWRVELEAHVATFPEDAMLVITGPEIQESSRTRTPALLAAASAIVDRARAAARDDDAGAADADAAKRRLEEAIRELRVETTLIPVTAADAAEAAPALKRALPWATFSADPRTNSIIAAGTAQELAAAADLVASLDHAATQKRAAEADARAKRIESTPYGRFTGRPLTIEFEGGTLGEFLSKLASESGFRSWIVEEPQAENASIPPIRLVSVSGDSALRALDGMPVQLTRFGQTIQTALTVQRIDPGLSEDGAMLPIYRIGMPLPAPLVQQPQRTPARPDVRTEVFLVGRASDPSDPAAIEAANAPLLAAIETAISLQEGESTLRLKLHPPSRMLFASGSSEELALVRAIMQTWVSWLSQQ